MPDSQARNCLAPDYVPERTVGPIDQQNEEQPHVNPNTRAREFALRDPDGYYVMISALALA
jgi:hypothetical protein